MNIASKCIKCKKTQYFCDYSDILNIGDKVICKNCNKKTSEIINMW